jgi:hypothetical protein
MTSRIAHRLLICARRALVVAFYLGFAIKTLIPVGFMPAALSSGWPLMLCDGMPTPTAPMHASAHSSMHSTSMDSGAMSGHNEESGPSHLWKHCPLGALASAAGMAHTAQTIVAIEAPQTPLLPPGAERPVVRPQIGFRSRAPPALS